MERTTTEIKIPTSFCMCCGDAADVRYSDEGYSHCCNDRITSDPMEHPLVEDVEDPRTVKIVYTDR